MNTKLKCLLLDDELPSLTYLKMLCEQIPELEVVRAFNDPSLFVKQISELDFDLCIMDVQMPGITGLQIAGLLKERPVIFVTAFTEYAADAFDLDAIDYIRKPIKPERLRSAVQKALVRMGDGLTTKNYLQLNTDRGKALIYPDQLIYVRASETDSRDKVALMENSSAYLLKNISFAALLKLLPSGSFCQINRKEVIALRSVRFFSHDVITTNLVQPDGKFRELLLNDTYRKRFIELVSV